MRKRLIIAELDKGEKESVIEVNQPEELTYVLLGVGTDGEKKVTIKINSANANVKILGIIVGLDGEIKIQTIQHHQKPDTTSDLLIKSIMFADAKLYFDGLIKIDHQAQRSNAYQRNENLMMSKQTHVESKPELEILANDVRCTHGVTISCLDNDVLFYLMSRGVDRQEAEKIILEGFLQPIVQMIDDKNISRKIHAQIQKTLLQATNIVQYEQ